MFNRRKRSSGAVSNPFGRKLSADDAALRDAPRSVQQSLFSSIRAVGYEGSAASSIAWKLIKAVRPAMTDSAVSLRQIGGCPHDEITELRACAVASSERESMTANSARAELVGDVIAMLDGLLSREPHALPASPSLVVAGAGAAAPREPGDDEFDLRLARLGELTSGGMAGEAAALVVMQEAAEREKASKARA